MVRIKQEQSNQIRLSKVNFIYNFISKNQIVRELRRLRLKEVNADRK
jgi:hypothetical protein